MVAGPQRGVRLLGSADGEDQVGLKTLDALNRGRPVLHMRRLDDVDVNRLHVPERPSRRRRAYGGGNVKERLRVLLRFNRHAVTELPVNQYASITNTANQVGGTKNAREYVAKTNNLLNVVLHDLVRVDDVQRRQRREQLTLQPVAVEFDAVVDGAKELLGRLARLQHRGDDVVQQRALVGVLAGGLGRHLLDERDAAGAIDDALGGRTADDV